MITPVTQAYLQTMIQGFIEFLPHIYTALGTLVVASVAWMVAHRAGWRRGVNEADSIHRRELRQTQVNLIVAEERLASERRTTTYLRGVVESLLASVKAASESSGLRIVAPPTLHEGEEVQLVDTNAHRIIGKVANLRVPREAKT